MKLIRSFLLFTSLLVFWPSAYAVSSYLRFGVVDHLAIHELYSFIPLGLISGLAVLLPLLSRKYAGCLPWGLAGFIIAAPIAYIASLYGGLILPPWLSATLLGSAPILAFTYIGYKVGEKVRHHSRGYSYY